MEKSELQKQIEKAVTQAFKMGEQWGVTYSGWFTPSEQDTQHQIDMAIVTILNDWDKNS